MSFKETLNKKVTEAEKVITAYLPEEAGFQRTVIDAMNYSVQAGGKRLRPIFMKECYTLFGGKGKVIEPFMAAMEMIHTYSLVHDDLPAMDNDAYRRGRKTTHIMYGEAMGILAGDGLLNYAFETAIKAFTVDPDNRHIPAALKILAEKAGIYGMIGGQTVDVESEGLPLDREMLAGASEEQVARVEAAAADIGLAFQIQDDILDVTSTTEVLGKPIHSDEKNHKTTYVTLEGLDKASKDVEEISGRALDVLKTFPGRNTFLEELVAYLIHREK